MKKPIDNLDKIKRIRATIDRTLKPAKKIVYKKGNYRENVPWLELQFLKVKAWVRNDIVFYLDNKADLFISESAKQMIRSYGWVVILILISIALTIKYLL